MSERRGDDRRAEDIRMAEAFTEFAPIEHGHDEIHQIIDILQGEESLGGVRKGGLADDVADVKATLNGGIDATLSTAQKVAIAAAGIGGLASIISAWILT